jgi:hypothetical protein
VQRVDAAGGRRHQIVGVEGREVPEQVGRGEQGHLRLVEQRLQRGAVVGGRGRVVSPVREGQVGLGPLHGRGPVARARWWRREVLRHQAHQRRAAVELVRLGIDGVEQVRRGDGAEGLGGLAGSAHDEVDLGGPQPPSQPVARGHVELVAPGASARRHDPIGDAREAAARGDHGVDVPRRLGGHQAGTRRAPHVGDLAAVLEVPAQSVRPHGAGHEPAEDPLALPPALDADELALRAPPRPRHEPRHVGADGGGLRAGPRDLEVDARLGGSDAHGG